MAVLGTETRPSDTSSGSEHEEGRDGLLVHATPSVSPPNCPQTFRTHNLLWLPDGPLSLPAHNGHVWSFRSQLQGHKNWAGAKPPPPPLHGWVQARLSLGAVFTQMAEIELTLVVSVCTHANMHAHTCIPHTQSSHVCDTRVHVCAYTCACPHALTGVHADARAQYTHVCWQPAGAGAGCYQWPDTPEEARGHQNPRNNKARGRSAFLGDPVPFPRQQWQPH